MAGAVSGIRIYPVKSCRGIDLTEVDVGPTGLAGDRRWQVVSGGAPVTQRTKTILATVHTELIDGGVRLSAAGAGTLEVAEPTAADLETGSLTGLPIRAADAGDEAAAWFAALLDDSDARLHGLPADGGLTLPEPIDIFHGQRTAFGDLAPVLVTNTASLDWLVSHADESFGMDRFRSNVIVTTDEPFAEDTWESFSLGQVAFRHGAAWPRCAMPQVDQVSGARHKEPAKVLAAHRKVTSAPEVPDALKPIVEGSAIFGIGCAAGPEGTVLKIGDALDVAAQREPMLPPPAQLEG